MEKAALIKLAIDTVKGNVLNFSAHQASESIRKEFVELMGTDKPDFRTFRKFKNEIFEIMEVALDNLITSGVTQSPFFEQFVEYRDLNLGDKNEFYVEDRSVLTISKIAGGHYDLRRQKLNIGDSFSVTTSWYGAKVYTDFLRFLAGRVDWAGLVRKIDEAMRLQMYTDIMNAFIGATTYLPAEFKKTGSFTDVNLDDLVQHVSVANNYAPLVVAGTRNALKKINGAYSSQSFLVSENMKDQINQSGLLNVYNGIPLLELQQVHLPNTFTFALDDTKLFVLPSNSKPVKVVREGQSIIQENSDGSKNMDQSMEYTFQTMYGLAVQFNNAYGVYTLS
jgi:hypothetical protein